jgi:competence protein ComEC
MDEATIEAFRTTGLAHLVAVSGSNVAVLLVLVMLVARRVSRRRWMHVAIALPALLFFTFLTGLEASVLRAVVTASIALFVTVEGRTADGIRVASFAFVVLVLAAPELLFHPGFQLSFAATLGLIVWARPLTEVIARRLPDGGVWLAVAACFGTTLAAQAAAAPLLAWHFGRIPALGGLANLLVAPLAPVVMIGGIATLTLASLVPGMGAAPVLMRLPLDAILWCGRTFSRLPSASFEASVLAGIVVTATLAALLASTRRGRVASVALGLVALGAAGGGALAGPPCADARIVALDVGQGTAVLLSAGGHSVLVDGGPQAGDVLDDLAEQGVDALDAVFVSHPHADHTQGVVDVLDHLEVGGVYGPATMAWGQGGFVVRAAKHAGVPVVRVASADTFRFGDRLSIEVVFPASTEEPLHVEDNVHAYSLVLHATVADSTILLPGDVGAAEEAGLLDASVVGASVLVAPHHGSKDLDPAFVEAVGPRVVLVTVGEDNRYGHPAPEAMRVYAASAKVFRTDRQGAVALCLSDGGRTAVRTER